MSAHYGQRPIIYTAPDFYRDNLTGRVSRLSRSGCARWPLIPPRVYPSRKWVFWQYSGSGLSHGVEGKIDLNVFHGNENEWQNWLARRAS